MDFLFKRIDKWTFLLLFERPIIHLGFLRKKVPNPQKTPAGTASNGKGRFVKETEEVMQHIPDPMDVSVVSVNDLHSRLGFSMPLEYPHSSQEKPLTQWKMEVDDSPVFRYLYRNFKPRRHLEFGTWQGTGVLYCLEECDATVWTINKSDGETQADSAWSYGNMILPDWAEEIPAWAKKKIFSDVCSQTDALGMIGRFYLEKGLGNRVCQIYCDSRNWAISNYPQGFFDSVLIDGGHTEDVIVSDTRKALPLLRPGGLVMWHDFCPVESVYNAYESTRGAYDAIKNNYDWLASQLEDLFWIKPSWILAGIKKGK